jgi:hypothetical protein
MATYVRRQILIISILGISNIANSIERFLTGYYTGQHNHRVPSDFQQQLGVHKLFFSFGPSGL